MENIEIKTNIIKIELLDDFNLDEKPDDNGISDYSNCPYENCTKQTCRNCNIY